MRLKLIWRACILGGVGLMMQSCSGPAAYRDKLSSMGLVESVIGRDEVHKAMDLVNSLIKTNNIDGVLCGWECNEFSDQEVYYFLTQPEGLPLETIAQSSKENNSIFVASTWRTTCDDIFRLSEDDSVLRTHALALVLLHELGHIVDVRKHIKVFSKDITLDSFQLKNEDLMMDELFADFFAAQIVKANKGETSLKLQRDIEELRTRVDIYFWSRYETHGGGLRMMLSEPAKRFGDLTYSHPNLNLRMHLISYLTDPTDEKLRRLRWIQEQRRMFSDVNTFTRDVMDGLTYLRNIPDDDTLHVREE